LLRWTARRRRIDDVLGIEEAATFAASQKRENECEH
jgi:hypothetical protein